MGITERSYHYVRVGACEIKEEIAAPSVNLKRMEEKAEEALGKGVHLLAFSECSLSGYTCGDLFLSDTLLNSCLDSIDEFVEFSKGKKIVLVFGFPFEFQNSLYNCAGAVFDGKLLGVVPKSFIPNYSEFYEARYFASGKGIPTQRIRVGHQEGVPFGTDLIFADSSCGFFRFGVEICEDLWVPDSPDIGLVKKGAEIIVNLSASDELVDKDLYRKDLVRVSSAKLNCAYIYSSCGEGESSQDVVFSGHKIVAENGTVLTESRPFEHRDLFCDLDLERIHNARRKMTTFENDFDRTVISFDLPVKNPAELLRHVARNPFLASDEEVEERRARQILTIQKEGLIQRLKAISCSRVVVGLSGGLDSTLTLLVAVEAFKEMKADLKQIYALTLPALGTTSLTRTNAEILSKELGVSFQAIDIKAAVDLHFRDIGHDPSVTNAAYENAQARERTQILMDFANDHGALMLGTSDLSELCLGWTTFNGDHMSMYNPNAGVPKTLVQSIVKTYAKDHKEVSPVLLSVLNTPISPELLPPSDDKIVQTTESKVGPYELVDFYLFAFLRRNYSLHKIFFMAEQAYMGKYGKEFLYKYLEVFVRRFFSNQFKRSCLPDGAKIGTVAVSPRGDLRMPSDASKADYLKELEEIKKENGLD